MAAEGAATPRPIAPGGHIQQTPSAATRARVSRAPDIAVAVAYGPSGRRRRWIALVEVCPRCGRAHVHYGTPAGPPRRRSCGGHQYLLHAIYGGHSDPAEVIA